MEINEKNKPSSLKETFPLLFPEKKERHQLSRPPEEAYLYIPQGKEEIDDNSHNPTSTRRKIFGINFNLLSDFEKLKLNEYKEYTNKSGHEDIAKLDYETILRFLQSNSFIFSTTTLHLNQHLEWKKTYLPPIINSNVEKILNSNFMYIHGRDHHYRPLVVINANQYFFLKNKYSCEDFIRATVYISEYIIEHMLIRGQIESWNIICDLSDVSLVFLPKDLMEIFKMMQHNYRARLNKLFVLGMGVFLNAVWALVSKLLDSSTNKKIQFIRSDNYEKMFEIINKSQVEARYGGSAENIHIDQDFFPPIMPSSDYKVDPSDRSYVSEETYLRLVHEGRITQPSPFLVGKYEASEGILTLILGSVYEDAVSRLNSEYKKSEFEVCENTFQQDVVFNNYYNAKNCPNEVEKFVISNGPMLKSSTIYSETKIGNMMEYQCERETAILAKSNCQSEMKEKIEQEIKNKITYESAVKHACCSPKEKCVIF